VFDPVIKQEQGEPVGDGEFEELLESYWNLAYTEGETGESHGDKANEILFRLRTLYTIPQQRKPLTDEAIATVYRGATGQSLRPQDNVLAHKFAKAIEATHGIKE
jgi:transposase